MRPVGFSVYLKYICECGTDHWLTSDQAKAGFLLVCDVCKKKHKIDRVKNIQARIDFCTSSSKKIAKSSGQLANYIIDASYNVLKTYGYSRKEIEQFYGLKNPIDKNSLIKQFLAEQTT